MPKVYKLHPESGSFAGQAPAPTAPASGPDPSGMTPPAEAAPVGRSDDPDRPERPAPGK